MRTLSHYITRSILGTFLTTVVVFTFVVSIGGLFQLSNLVAKGVAVRPILVMFASGMPSALSFAIPISALTATLLVFGRLSADSEITAMRACGIGVWRMMGWVMPLSFLFAFACLYVNNMLVPEAHFARRTAAASLSSINPADLLEEGRPIEFDGLRVYVGRKSGDRFEDVRIYDLRVAGQTREIKAKWGTVSPSTNGNEIVMALEEVTIDPFSFDRPVPAYCREWTERIKSSGKQKVYKKRVKDMSFFELVEGMRKCLAGAHDTVEDAAKARMVMSVELHTRLALSCSCIAFMFLGVPLGIKSHRKESSVGIGMSLLFVFAFYLFIIVAKELSGHPELYPDMLTWVPVILAVLIGMGLIRRMH
ncbi:MAG: YjgP/YjgQ family permease [Verrucomicrobia bacterium]|nr:YjgP/YjgQ family permease [Verrucomicrobiota bacterium]